MRIFALSDLHLSFSGKKPMDVFGEHWRDHARAIEAAWRAAVGSGDVVCLPGDFSWALRLDETAPELAWLGSLPGRKVLIKGNHDYWWASPGKVRAALPEGVFAIQNDSVTLDGVAFAGARGWVDNRLDFSGLCARREGEAGEFDALAGIQGEEEDKKLYLRDLGRLETSLASMNPDARLRIALLHFPPTSPALEPTEVTELLERHRVDVVVFGHLHLTGPSTFKNPYGARNGVTYYLTSADFIGFRPLAVADIDTGTP
jgi:predicted phosphohydrolase